MVRERFDHLARIFGREVDAAEIQQLKRSAGHLVSPALVHLLKETFVADPIPPARTMDELVQRNAALGAHDAARRFIEFLEFLAETEQE